ncbi:MAG: hypothetical protein A2431_02750 [Candidatus Zambryskibacteria bacterium RIFOXYC1_FULL_39_10]|uniref:Uncharacterized protein n=1 Tax=Candidatus Zambryskibacteria bacterium RIFOXYC1_FULL_39_10 TaxID=1802779 RepID=A0A1G2UXZ8_9BACT|nr:MAG: hypothetical protein A2431_02750 [Candidatus Zambryskibacteria bacterium RIFOXYC1_FULL_39_10]OHB14797.1 MAG: hypothetical protein A2605_04050 [Candidatus Zambryskibacteria bacterium RIFOXYD1_FULL_39_35]
MDNETLVSSIAGILGHYHLPQIRTVLGVPESEEENVKWKDELEKATTVDECIEVYNNEESEKGEIEALEKALTLANTVDEYGLIYDSSHSEAIRKKAVEKIEALLASQLETATTMNECFDISKSSHGGLREGALEKALTLAKTVEECRRVIRQSCPTAIREKAVERIETILSSKLEVATTVEECLGIMNNTGSPELRQKTQMKIDTIMTPKIDSVTTVRECLNILGKCCSEQLRKRNFERAFALATTVKDWALVFRLTKNHSPEADMCIRTIAEILQKEQ